jgi:uncharacterized protein
MPPLSFAGHDFHVVDRTALYWPRYAALIVADLHLEKASWFAARGQMLPPHDSLATLERLARAASSVYVKTIWCLGDNFHDDDGAHRIGDTAKALLTDLTSSYDWRWITGNHDAALPPLVGGTILDEAEIEGVVLCHEADPRRTRPEMSGHFHPKYRAQGARGAVTRPCFVMSQTKLILPAFGALTGGLYAHHDAIRRAVGPSAEALVASGERLLRFAL